MGSARLFYLDNLRALAMLAGVFFHAALAYSPMAQPFWPSADVLNHPLFDVFAWASHLFRMPVFFLLAGFFAAMLLHKYGDSMFWKNRLRRIGLPLLLFLPLLTLTVGAVIQFGMAHVKHQPPFLAFIQSMLNQAEPPAMPLSTMHLWFLYHLLFLYLLTWSGRILLNRQMLSWITELKPNTLVLLLILACVPALYSVTVPFPAPEWIFPALWALWFYGVFFSLGYACFSMPALLAGFDPLRHYYLLLGAVSYAVYYALLPATLMPQSQPQSWLKLAITSLESCSAVLWTLCALLYARRYLNWNSRALAYLSNVSFWLYIVHLPLLFFVQFILIDLPLALWTKFIVSSGVTLAISLLGFHILVAPTWLASVLAGSQRR
ncbi:acyltransferase family protein [Arsukibacterium indicum]|uniref:Acyltransferase family protein n=1 Tax=Arsukibacterium indicum TaxID=2848612 RepID=A0ABS6MKS4_9GAMM|nr:acyltransferase family protein [Arsukibacterium indicum]MBV2129417.1 acyltransferase family protein [Arsukibacterium indicum]